MKRLNATGTGLIALSFLSLAAVPVAAQPNSENVRALNARILNYHALLGGANAAQVAQIRADAAPVFAQRATALKNLIREAPGTALGLAFSQDLVDDLGAKFPSSAGFLERHGAWQGTSDHVILDDPDRQVRQFQVQIRAGDETLQVFSAQGEPHCVSGNLLTARGVRVDNYIAAADTSVQGAAVAAAGCSTLGAQNAAILLVQFPGISLPASVTPTGVWDIFFAASGRSVDNYWREASYGKASATGNVFGPYTLSRSYTCDEYNAMRSAAIAAADADVHFPSYTRIFVVFPDPGSCGWAGLGTLGCGTLSSADGSFTASSSWLLANYMGSRDNGVKLATHEGGHNLTLHHSSSRDFGAEALGPVGAAGTLSEYGDGFSTMGSWNFGHYPAQHKAQMGWLSGGNVVTTETNGSYGILPFETPTAGVQAVKVRRGAGNNAWLWIEYRQPVGQYDSTLSPHVFTGGLTHYQDSTTGTHTHLVDFTPSTTGFSDSALTGTWVDPYTNLSLSVSGATSSALSLNVSYGALPCTVVQPTVTISPSNPTVPWGTTVSQTVSVKNNDAAGCTASTFVLTSALPAGWSTSFSPASLTISPGQTATATMTKTVPTGITGTFAVDATASDANHSAAGTANVTVTAPPPPITVTVSATPAVVKARGTVTINATVTNSSGPVSGASVTFTVNRPNGPVSQTTTTNSSGVATWMFKAQQKGSYSVTATANSNGVTATSSPATFTAQ
jgi:M6 family metalloprotease-like protein